MKAVEFANGCVGTEEGRLTAWCAATVAFAVAFALP